MARTALSQRQVDALKPKKQLFAVTDTALKGFGVQVWPSGALSYFVHTQHDGKRFSKVVGDAKTLPLDAARARAAKAIATVKRGDSVVAVHAGQTQFEAVAEEVFRRYARHWKPQTRAVNRSYYRRHILPWFQGRQITDIEPQDVQRWFASLYATPFSADRSVPVLSVIMRQAEVYGYRPEGSNPCKGIRRYRRRERERFLSPKELQRLTQALERHAVPYPMETAVIRLLLLTGCRKSEIGTLRWSEYREGKLFLADSKTGPRTVWLCSAARAIVDGLARGGHWVFKTKRMQRPVRAVERAWRRVRKDADLIDVRLHDLRHTYASIATMEGETILVVSKLLGHSDPSTTLKYTHLSYATLNAAVNAVGSVLGNGR